MSKKFIKKVEDFKCLHCGFEVKGNGFTNHCPKCLWGRHVDISPGDRAEKCLGMMEPVRMEGSTKASSKSGRNGLYGSYSMVHKCQRCGFERKNKVQEDDLEESILKVAAKYPC